MTSYIPLIQCLQLHSAPVSLVFLRTNVSLLGQTVPHTFTFLKLIFPLFQIQVNIFIVLFKKLIYFIVLMLWTELCPHNFHTLKP